MAHVQTLWLIKMKSSERRIPLERPMPFVSISPLVLLQILMRMAKVEMIPHLMPYVINHIAL